MSYHSFAKKAGVILLMFYIVALTGGCCCTERRKHSERNDRLLRQYPIYDQIPKPAGYADVPRVPDYRTAAERFKNRIQKSADPSELQDWARTLLKTYGKEAESVDLDEQALPSIVKELDSKMGAPRVSVKVKPESSKPFVLIVWGGGFAVWGLQVGMRISFRITNGCFSSSGSRAFLFFTAEVK